MLVKPTFDKKTADDYYPRMYSQAPLFDTALSIGFTFLQVLPTPVTFKMSPIKSKDIRNLLSQTKSA